MKGSPRLGENDLLPSHTLHDGRERRCKGPEPEDAWERLMPTPGVQAVLEATGEGKVMDRWQKDPEPYAAAPGRSWASALGSLLLQGKGTWGPRRTTSSLQGRQN